MNVTRSVTRGVLPHRGRCMWHYHQFWRFRNQKNIKLRGKKKELTKALEDDSTDKMKQDKIATKTIREK